MPRTGPFLKLALAAALLVAAACSDVQRPKKALRPPNVAKRLAAKRVPPPPRATHGHVFSPDDSGAEGATSSVPHYCQPPEGGRDTSEILLSGAFPPPVRVNVFYHDTVSLIKPAVRCVIRDEDDWIEFHVLGRLTVDKTVLLDFGREMMLVAGTGEKPSGGYDLRFDRVVMRRDTLWAFVASMAPRPGAVIADDRNSAVEVLRLPRFDGTVVFVEQ